MADEPSPAAGSQPCRAAANERGNLTVMTSLAFTVLLGFVGLGVDVSSWYSVKRSMQTAVDSAAMAAAYDYSIYIARQFEVSSGASVTINENYDQSDVPLPPGLDNGRSVALIR